jgi:GTP:adenosylcobinamide-phosphate guanylyltransferase
VTASIRLFVMAGGHGTRAGSMKGHLPKPLIHVDGVPQLLGVIELIDRDVSAHVTVVANDSIARLIEACLARSGREHTVAGGFGVSPLEDLDLAMRMATPSDFVLVANGDTALLGLNDVPVQLLASGTNGVVAWRVPTMGGSFREPWVSAAREPFQNTGLWGGRWTVVRRWVDASRAAGYRRAEDALGSSRFAPLMWHEVEAAYDLGTAQRMSEYLRVGWGARP